MGEVVIYSGSVEFMTKITECKKHTRLVKMVILP